MGKVKGNVSLIYNQPKNDHWSGLKFKGFLFHDQTFTESPEREELQIFNVTQ